jgi:hypothetical protein
MAALEPLQERVLGAERNGITGAVSAAPLKIPECETVEVIPGRKPTADMGQSEAHGVQNTAESGKEIVDKANETDLGESVKIGLLSSRFSYTSIRY